MPRFCRIIFRVEICRFRNKLGYIGMLEEGRIGLKERLNKGFDPIELEETDKITGPCKGHSDFSPGVESRTVTMNVSF
jgi:hypothetical protein